MALPSHRTEAARCRPRKNPSSRREAVGRRTTALRRLCKVRGRLWSETPRWWRVRVLIHGGRRLNVAAMVVVLNYFLCARCSVLSARLCSASAFGLAGAMRARRAKVRQAVIFSDSFRHVELRFRFFSILFDMTNINSTCRTSNTTCRHVESTCRTSNSTCRMSNSIMFDTSLFHFHNTTYVFEKFDTSWSVSSDLQPLQ